MQLNNSAHYYQFPKGKMHETLEINGNLQRKKTNLKTMHIKIILNVPLFDF